MLLRVIEENCVGCPTELGCLGGACPYMHMHVDYCDECGDDGAEYKIDGIDMCETCAKDYLMDAFKDMTVPDMASVLDIECEYIY